MFGNAVIQKHPRNMGNGLDLGQFETGVLHLQQRLAKGDALGCIGNRFLQRLFHRGSAAQGDHQTLLWQGFHQLIKPLALSFAQQVLRWHPHIVKEQLRGVLAFEAQFFQIAPAGKPRRFGGLDHDQRNTFGAEARVGFGHHDDQVRLLAIGDKGLGTVDHIFVALQPGCGLDVLQI